MSDPDVVSDERFPLVWVVPITGTAGEGARLPGSRARRVFGKLAQEEIAVIDEGLALFLGLGDRPHGA